MPRRVLLIEDEPNIIEAIRFILAREGLQVDTHADGATALDEVRHRAPEVVILDAMLPNRSGFDILSDIRNDAELSATPVLMLTARGQQRDREMAERVGANLFMTKPFSNADVLTAVRSLLARGAA